MSTPTTETTFINGAVRIGAGFYLAATGIIEIASATYEVTAPIVSAVGSAAYSITSNYIVPTVIDAGSATISTITKIVKGKPTPAAPIAEAFDLHEEVEEDFVNISNGRELASIQRTPSVPF